MGEFPVLIQRLALEGKYRGAAGGDRGSSMILGGINIAGCPAHVRAQRIQGLDQHGRLDGHVQAAGNAGAFERLLVAVFLTQGHQSRHFGFGNGNFLAAEIRLAISAT